MIYQNNLLHLHNGDHAECSSLFNRTLGAKQLTNVQLSWEKMMFLSPLYPGETACYFIQSPKASFLNDKLKNYHVFPH